MGDHRKERDSFIRLLSNICFGIDRSPIGRVIIVIKSIL